jgi:hypothetical protein
MRAIVEPRDFAAGKMLMPISSLSIATIAGNFCWQSGFVDIQPV